MFYLTMLLFAYNFSSTMNKDDGELLTVFCKNSSSTINQDEDELSTAAVCEYSDIESLSSQEGPNHTTSSSLTTIQANPRVEIILSSAPNPPMPSEESTSKENPNSPIKIEVLYITTQQLLSSNTEPSIINHKLTEDIKEKTKMKVRVLTIYDDEDNKIYYSNNNPVTEKKDKANEIKALFLNKISQFSSLNSSTNPEDKEKLKELFKDDYSALMKFLKGKYTSELADSKYIGMLFKYKRRSTCKNEPIAYIYEKWRSTNNNNNKNKKRSTKNNKNKRIFYVIKQDLNTVWLMSDDENFVEHLEEESFYKERIIYQFYLLSTFTMVTLSTYLAINFLITMISLKS